MYLEPKKSSRFKSVRKNFEADVNSNRGAILMGVCRGKISEGLDFSDRAARCVIIIGMPFAQWNDPKVQLKMEYLNRKCKQGESTVTGRDWYNQEASRAVNQAIGRVIRHIHDYGLILLFDKRYAETRVKNERSKWLRETQTNFGTFEDAYKVIKTFFEDMQKLDLKPKKVKEHRVFDSSDDDEVDTGFRARKGSTESNLSLGRSKLNNFTQY